MLFLVFVGLMIISVHCIDYYLNKTNPPNPNGKNCATNYNYDNSSLSHNIPCTDVDYVMKILVNVTNRISAVYVDSGVYNYSILSYIHSTPLFFGYFNLTFKITGNVSSSSSFNINDISTYPVILSNNSDISVPNYVFLLYANISASFQYIKFLIGNNSDSHRQFIASFFFFFFFLFIFVLFFIYFRFIFYLFLFYFFVL
jgi:hypothetical protein